MTKTIYDTNTKLNRIAWLSSENPKKELTSLMHLYNRESLINCFLELNGKKAIGIDGITKEKYGENLYQNIDDLIERMKRMAYRPGPVKQVLIPKEGKPGATRPLGISNFEDKIIQKMTQKILEAIYEPLFKPCSYGFRPRRGCHDAIKDLQHYLWGNEVETVIDLDLGNFFGTIDHKILEEFLRVKIKDTRFMRYIIRMFKAGTLKNGDMMINEEGVPQGNIASPVMANIYAHYVIDVWIEEMVKPACKGKIRLFRYADDVIICCEREEDARRIMEVLGKRLERFKLRLNEEKTKMVSFSKSKIGMGIKQGTFDFLGFTFYLGRSKRNKVIPKLKTSKKRLRSKLAKVKEWLKENRNKTRLRPLWETFCAKLRGHNQYYGMSHNSESIRIFSYEARRLFFKWINRRSQRKSFNWEKFHLFLKRYPPPTPRIIHKLF